MSITAEGQKLLDRLDEPESALHKRLIGHLSPAELQEISRLLEKARQSLDKVATD